MALLYPHGFYTHLFSPRVCHVFVLSSRCSHHYPYTHHSHHHHHHHHHHHLLLCSQSRYSITLTQPVYLCVYVCVWSRIPRSAWNQSVYSGNFSFTKLPLEGNRPFAKPHPLTQMGLSEHSLCQLWPGSNNCILCSTETHAIFSDFLHFQAGSVDFELAVVKRFLWGTFKVMLVIQWGLKEI